MSAIFQPSNGEARLAPGASATKTTAPTIVNSFAFEDGSKKAYGRFSVGFSAAIFSSVGLDVGGSATIGKDQGDETSAQLGLHFGF